MSTSRGATDGPPFATAPVVTKDGPPFSTSYGVTVPPSSSTTNAMADSMNEYPFLITESGISVMPITSLGLLHDVSTERVSTGVVRLDAMLGDGGFYKGSTVLISGTAGTGKSTLAAAP